MAAAIGCARCRQSLIAGGRCRCARGIKSRRDDAAAVKCRADGARRRRGARHRVVDPQIEIGRPLRVVDRNAGSASNGDVVPMPPGVVVPSHGARLRRTGRHARSHGRPASMPSGKASSARLPPVNDAAAMQRATRKDDPSVWNNVTRAARAPASPRPAGMRAAGAVQGADAGSAGTAMCHGGMAGAASELSAWAAR